METKKIKVISKEVTGSTTYYEVNAVVERIDPNQPKGEIQAVRTIKVRATLAEMYYENSDSFSYDFDLNEIEGLMADERLTDEEEEEIEEQAKSGRFCGICKQAEDEDGRCGCTNSDSK